MNRIRGKLTYANVIATLALFIALGGSAVAAKHYLITSTSQISPVVLKKLQGPKGSSGANGTPGVVGATGAQGAPGGNGAPGTPGGRGETGSVAIGPWHYVGTAGEIPFGTEFKNEYAPDPVRFRSEGDLVRLEGEFGTSQPGTWSTYTHRLVITLPEGFRPKGELFLQITPESNNVPGTLVIEPDGECFVLGPASGWGQMNSVTFSTS
jgi:hypothetical protein